MLFTFLKKLAFRSEGPALNRPGRQAGIYQRKYERRRCGTQAFVPALRASFVHRSYPELTLSLYPTDETEGTAIKKPIGRQFKGQRPDSYQPGATPQADMVPRLYKKVNPDMYVDLLPTVLTVSRSESVSSGLLTSGPSGLSRKKETALGVSRRLDWPVDDTDANNPIRAL
jgi:hypothetical protein